MEREIKSIKRQKSDIVERENFCARMSNEIELRLEMTRRNFSLFEIDQFMLKTLKINFSRPNQFAQQFLFSHTQ
jgi:hypothetical protein